MTTKILCSPSRPALRLPDLLPHNRRREFAILRHFLFFFLFLSLLSLLDFFFFLLLFFLIPLSSIRSLPPSELCIHGCERLNDYSISRCHGHTLKRSEKNRYDSSQQERVTLSKGWTNQLLYPTPRKALEAEAPNVHEQRSVIAYFERGKGEEVVGKELTTNYEFEHHRP